MGLDAWLMAKTKARQNTDENSATGACSGLFGIIPTAVADAVELCYLRKGYDQSQLLCECGTCSSDGSDDGFTWHFTKSDIEWLLEEARHILATHRFNADGEDLTDDDPRFTSDNYTWMSKSKWEDLIKGLEEAKSILEEDPEADIYYHEWF